MSYEPSSGLIDWFIPPVVQEANDAALHAVCTGEANAAQQSLDAEADRVRLAWPSERTTFRVDMMANTVASTKQMLEVAAATLVRQLAAKYEVLALNQQLAAVRARIAGAQKFVDGIAAARRQGIEKISSQDFRKWVVSSCYEAGSGYYAVALVACQQAWTRDAFKTLFSAYNAVRGAVVAMINAVVDVAGAVLDLPSDIASFVSTLVSVATVAAAAYVGYRVYGHVKKRKDRGG